MLIALNVRCAHSEGQDPTGSDKPSRLCLNLPVQPGPQPIKLVEVEAVK